MFSHKFQIDSVNTPDLTASCVCVCVSVRARACAFVVTRYENAETKSRAALRDQILPHLT
jgi:hypothetical protein